MNNNKMESNPKPKSASLFIVQPNGIAMPFTNCGQYSNGKTILFVDSRQSYANMLKQISVTAGAAILSNKTINLF